MLYATLLVGLYFRATGHSHTVVTTLLHHFGGFCLLSAEDVWFHVKSRGRVALGSCYEPQGSQTLASPVASATLHAIGVSPGDLGPMPGGLPSLLSGFPSRCWGLSVSKDPTTWAQATLPPPACLGGLASGSIRAVTRMQETLVFSKSPDLQEATDPEGLFWKWKLSLCIPTMTR